MRMMWVVVSLAVLAGPAAGQDVDEGLGTPVVANAGPVLRPFDSTARVVTETMRRDLARVHDAEVAYYAANRRYAENIADLGVVTVDGTEIAIENADERSYRAVARNERLPGVEVELVTLLPPPGVAGAPRIGRTASDSSGSDQ